MSRLALLLTLLTVSPLFAGPLKIYLLVGQSNMQGHAQVRTIEHLSLDPKTKPIYSAMTNADGTPKTIDNVWISSIGHDGTETERHGQLTADFGAAGRGPKIGPEYTFGIYAQKLVDQPILIIKTAWGGKSINTDFRPPSAGPYEFSDKQIENFRKQKKDIDEIKKKKVEATGRYYRLMTDHVKNVLADVKRVCPAYNEDEGYELAGFVWFQGWNDMVDGNTYPERGKPGSYDAYSTAMAHFIRDVRRELNAPKLPFVIGVMGAGGPIDKYRPEKKRYAGIHGEFRKAMAAPADLVEFNGNVTAVLTETCWDQQLGELTDRWGSEVGAKNRELNKDKSLSKEQRQAALDAFAAEQFTKEERHILDIGKSNAEYHYLGSGKVMAQIGKAFAEAVMELSNDAK